MKSAHASPAQRKHFCDARRIAGRSALSSLVVACAVLAVASPASAWDPFVSENDEVRDGNEQMAASEASAALRHYDQAARRLPNDPGVHLNRGLALLESGELDRAREALSLAAQPPASREIRADAHYDLGLTFYRQADEAAGTEDHEEAQRLFREAADSFRRSLRLRPGNGDAGWNLELALRRLREQEEQQEEQEQQEQEQQEQEEQQEQDESEGDEPEEQSGGDEPGEPNEDQEGQDQEGQDQEGQDQEGQDQEGQDQEGQDQEGQDQEGQDQEGQEGQPDPEAEGSDSSDGEDGASEEPGQDDPGSSEGRDAEEQPSTSGTQGDSMAPEHRRVLDALEDGEDNLERHRAAARAARERRRVEQDW